MTSSTKLRVLLLFCIACLTAQAQAPGPEIVLHNFGAPPQGGAYPDATLVSDPVGNFYGTTSAGGPNNAGVVYKLDSNGHAKVLYNFTGGADGGQPGSLVRDPQGNLYGVTYYGGAANDGVVFKLDPMGHETVLHSFCSVAGCADGRWPTGITRDSAGNLYGTTVYGGAHNGGVVFKLDPSGSETVFFSFPGGAGSEPQAGVILDPKGNLYGTADDVVFKLDRAGKQTVLYTFQGGTDGFGPGGLVRDAAGNLYGTASGGPADAGLVYKLDATGRKTVLYNFTGGADGKNPFAALVLDPQGNLYGTTFSGGVDNQGVVFQVDPAGNETVLHSFLGGYADGATPAAALLRDAAGNLYGTAITAGAQQVGIVFKLDPTGQQTVLYNFTGGLDGVQPYAGLVRDPDGDLYGTTLWGGTQANDGGRGVVFKLSPAGEETVLHRFIGGPLDGSGPNGPIVRDEAGNLYGTTYAGGASDEGAVFKLDTDGHNVLLRSFQRGKSGWCPSAGLVRDSEGNLYGTNNIGGTFADNCNFQGCGTVFKLDKRGRQTVPLRFNGHDGANPVASFIQDSAGNLYGTTPSGGTANAGVVFELNQAGEETVLYNFTGGVDGGSPIANLTFDSTGNLYGAASRGGTSNAGVIFKLDPSGNETVLYSFTGGADGANPAADVIFDPAGNLYGTTAAGGTSNAGVVFKLDPSGSETVLYSFTGGGDGGNPQAGVVRDPAGNLYGTTVHGGRYNNCYNGGCGVVFELPLAAQPD